MRYFLFTLIACALLSSASAQSGKKSSSSPYVSMEPVQFQTIADDAPVFVSYIDTTKADNHLAINTPLIAVGHVGNDWLVVSWNDRIYYLRPKYVGRGTPISSQSHGSNPRTIYTGPRGGQYYINGNGNKTYLKQ